MSRRTKFWFALAVSMSVATLLWSGPLARSAAAQVGGDEASVSGPLGSRVGTGLVIGGKVGAGIGEPASDFGATPIFELELEYLLPLDAPVGRSLGLFLAAQYAQPGMDGHGDADLRLPGDGAMSYELTQRQLTLSLGPLYRFDVGSELVMPYAGLGARMYLLRTEVKGEVDGVAFGDNEETKTGFGLLLLGGAELFVGPGALLGELQFGWGPLDTYVLRDTNLGALTLSLGYRLFF